MNPLSVQQPLVQAAEDLREECQRLRRELTELVLEGESLPRTERLKPYIKYARAKNTQLKLDIRSLRDEYVRFTMDYNEYLTSTVSARYEMDKARKEREQALEEMKECNNTAKRLLEQNRKGGR